MPEKVHYIVIFKNKLTYIFFKPDIRVHPMQDTLRFMSRYTVFW